MSAADKHDAVPARDDKLVVAISSRALFDLTESHALFEREGRDWPRFHAAVKALAQLPASERLQRLQRLQGDVSRAATQ